MVARAAGAVFVPTVADPVRVMLVDDSGVIRSFLKMFIEEDPEMRITATAGNGEAALKKLDEGQIDVLVLDIEMPVMDGLTALPLILKKDPDLQVIVASTLTKENAVITMKCFQAGAAECLPKPTADEMSASKMFKQNLQEKVKTLGIVTRRKRAARDRSAARPAAAPPSFTPSAASTVQAPLAPEAIAAVSGQDRKISLRGEIVRKAPDIIAIGSSTGGPQALMKFFTSIGTPLKQPVLITQHMPPTFTTILAEHISKQSGLNCREAVDGEEIRGGVIYLAPGNYHMTVKADAGKKLISLNQDPPENFCRPAVDPMMRSLVEAYGSKILAIIFTGMGSDGLKGCRAVVEAGGSVLAQDEASSVVWGMPGAVAMAGICSRVVPLDDMARTVREYADSIVRSRAGS